MPKYLFQMDTDDDFQFTYWGKPSRYSNELKLMFDFKYEANISRILNILDRIEIIDETRHAKDAIKRFSLLKREIAKGNLNVTVGGNYSFYFKLIEEDYDDVIRDYSN